MIIKPVIVVDEEGHEWLRPGMSFITQRMLGIDRKTLWQLAKDGETLTIDDAVWEEVISRELIWEPFHEGNRAGVRVRWRKNGLSGEIGEKT